MALSLKVAGVDMTPAVYEYEDDPEVRIKVKPLTPKLEQRATIAANPKVTLVSTQPGEDNSEGGHTMSMSDMVRLTGATLAVVATEWEGIDEPCTEENCRLLAWSHMDIASGAVARAKALYRERSGSRGSGPDPEGNS